MKILDITTNFKNYRSFWSDAIFYILAQLLIYILTLNPAFSKWAAIWALFFLYFFYVSFSSFLKFFGGDKSFLRGHWYPCFGLEISRLSFKARVGSLLALGSSVYVTHSLSSSVARSIAMSIWRVPILIGTCILSFVTKVRIPKSNFLIWSNFDLHSTPLIYTLPVPSVSKIVLKGLISKWNSLENFLVMSDISAFKSTNKVMGTPSPIAGTSLVGHINH